MCIPWRLFLYKRNCDNFVYQVSFLPDETHRTIYANGVTKGLRFVFADFKKLRLQLLALKLAM
jgi:hypothetical protein